MLFFRKSYLGKTTCVWLEIFSVDTSYVSLMNGIEISSKEWDRSVSLNTSGKAFFDHFVRPIFHNWSKMKSWNSGYKETLMSTLCGEIFRFFKHSFAPKRDPTISRFWPKCPFCVPSILTKTGPMGVGFVALSSTNCELEIHKRISLGRPELGSGDSFE